MRKIFFLLVFVLVSVISVSFQAIDGKEIRNRDVEWSDFTGEIDESSKHDAWTYWVTKYSFPAPQFDGDIARVKVKVRLFLRSDSWVRPNKKTNRLLNHERGHYRIGRICANEIEKTINSMDFNRHNYRQEVDAIYWEIINKYREINKQYDLDTNHYNNQAQQAIWDKKLNDLLKKK
jgi:Bacterial protein of unknown function (DUF922)